MARPNTLMVTLPVDFAARFKRHALSLGLKPATYARMLLLDALGATPPKKAKRS